MSDRIAKANCTENQICTSCDIVRSPCLKYKNSLQMKQTLYFHTVRGQPRYSSDWIMYANPKVKFNFVFLRNLWYKLQEIEQLWRSKYFFYQKRNSNFKAELSLDFLWTSTLEICSTDLLLVSSKLFSYFLRIILALYFLGYFLFTWICFVINLSTKIRELLF